MERHRIYDSERYEHTDVGLRAQLVIDVAVRDVVQTLVAAGFCPHEVAYHVAQAASLAATEESLRRRFGIVPSPQEVDAEAC